MNKSSKRARGNGSVLLTPLPSPVVHPESNNTVTIKPVGPGGPMIVDGGGNLVWFRQLTPPEVAANLRLQQYRGRKVLTWWEGTVTPAAFGVGGGVIANHAYNIIKTVHAGNGYPMDLHEFELTKDGDALLTVYSPIRVHLPGTPEGTLSPLLDSIVQEVDIKTGLVVWEWHSYGHIPLETSQATPQNSASYDAFHINAIQALQNDRVLISARDTSAVYKVDRASGRILWTLGGKGTDFNFGPGALFNLQHDAHMLSNGRISMFDDGAGPPMFNPYSRGLILQLDHRRHRATLVRQFARSTSTSAQSEGSLQRLPGGNVFVGFGSEPFFSEFSSRGKLLLDGSLPHRRRHLPDLPLPVERLAEDEAGHRRPAPGPHGGLALRELERGHAGGEVAVPGGPERRIPLADRDDAQAVVRDPRRPGHFRDGVRRPRPGLEGARDRPVRRGARLLTDGAYWPRPWTCEDGAAQSRDSSSRRRDSGGTSITSPFPPSRESASPR